MNGARIYISGPISGFESYQSRFKKAESEVIRLDSTYIPINPAKLGSAFGDSLDYSEYMKLDLQILDMCDGIYMLEGWQDSKGAKMELEYAKMKGIMIYYQDYTPAEKDIHVGKYSSFADIYRTFGGYLKGENR